MHLYAADDKTREISQIAVDEGKDGLDHDFEQFALLSEKNDLHRYLDHAQNIEPAAEGKQAADERNGIRQRGYGRGAEPRLCRKRNAHRRDKKSD